MGQGAVRGSGALGLQAVLWIEKQTVVPTAGSAR
jgi:hypothetical protein